MHSYCGTFHRGLNTGVATFYGSRLEEVPCNTFATSVKGTTCQKLHVQKCPLFNNQVVSLQPSPPACVHLHYYTPVECPSTGGPHTREWVLTDIADSTQLGTRERVRAKVRKIQATRTVAATGDGRREESEGRVREAERRAREAESDIKRKKEIAERQAMEAEGRAREAEDRARDAERGKEAAENRQRGAEQRLVESEGKLRRLETRLVVERREIQLTDQELGRGAWATVSVAIFRGACVAAKCVHNQIVSPHNIQLFKREMNMAARIRHPNLLLFIGATLEGEMVILTELMPTKEGVAERIPALPSTHNLHRFGRGQSP